MVYTVTTPLALFQVVMKYLDARVSNRTDGGGIRVFAKMIGCMCNLNPQTTVEDTVTQSSCHGITANIVSINVTIMVCMFVRGDEVPSFAVADA